MDLLRINGTRCCFDDGGVTMKLKTIQAFSLIALAIVILIGAVTGDFDTAELLMYTAVFVGLTAVHITTEDNI
jgi:hypothetical protein